HLMYHAAPLFYPEAGLPGVGTAKYRARRRVAADMPDTVSVGMHGTAGDGFATGHLALRPGPRLRRHQRLLSVLSGTRNIEIPHRTPQSARPLVDNHAGSIVACPQRHNIRQPT